MANYSPEELDEVHKDKRVMNILYSGTYSNMFEAVMKSSITELVWDIIQTLCEELEQVRENKIKLLI